MPAQRSQVNHALTSAPPLTTCYKDFTPERGDYQ
ncbi:hypothetical protein EPYR_00745 [Erwinia pyrifoliae DSM 12163]|nr:hypothetical protein EPYR_00745 [Erwinia pyrifoliae DSM 12163]